MPMTVCATRRELSTMREHLLPVVGQQVYPPSLWVEHPTDEGTPGETKGLDRESRTSLIEFQTEDGHG
jgi:hypothetical protein